MKGGGDVFGSLWHSMVDGFKANAEWPTKAGIAGGGLLSYHVTAFIQGAYLGAVLLALAVAAMMIDFLAGITFAKLRGDFQTTRLYEGTWGKIGRSFLIPVGIVWDLTVFYAASILPSGDVVQATVGNTMPWMSLACIWLVIGETGSTIRLVSENAGNSAVPGRFRRFIEKIGKWADGDDGKA
jgi:hypothetical protein